MASLADLPSCAVGLILIRGHHCLSLSFFSVCVSSNLSNSYADYMSFERNRQLNMRPD